MNIIKHFSVDLIKFEFGNKEKVELDLMIFYNKHIFEIITTVNEIHNISGNIPLFETFFLLRHLEEINPSFVYVTITKPYT